MLSERVIKEWNTFKEKLSQSTSEAKKLESLILTTHSEMKIKEEQMKTYYIFVRSNDLDNENYDKLQKVEAEWEQLKHQKNDLIEKLVAIHPLRTQLLPLVKYGESVEELKTKNEWLEEEITRLKVLASSQLALEEEINHLASEKDGYLQRIESAELRWESREQKLETVRELILIKDFTKLEKLFKKGKI